MPASVEADFVGSRDAEGGRLAAEHLLSLGHRDSAFIAGMHAVSSFNDRAAAFEAAMHDGGGTCTVVHAPEAPWHEADIARLLDDRPQVTAIACGSDYFAMTAYRVAHSRGLRIPEDLSVVGFADEPIAAMLAPPLTTLRQHPHEIGRQAAEALLARLRRPRISRRHVRVPVELVVRQSTAAPPRRIAL